MGRLVSICERRVVRDHDNVPELRESRSDFFAETVAEVALLRIAGRVRERNDDDRGLPGNHRSFPVNPSQPGCCGARHEQTGHERFTTRKCGRPMGCGWPGRLALLRHPAEALHRCRKGVAASRCGLDKPWAALAQRPPDVADALGQGVVGDDQPGPRMLNQFVFRDDLAGLREQGAKHVEALRPKIDVPPFERQRTTDRIEQELFEEENATVDQAHRSLP